MSKQDQDIVIRYHNKLLKKARTVFGDIVSSVAVVTHKYDHLPLADASHELDLLFEYLKQDKDDQALHFDAMTIIITFKNGRSVKFSNSEWASMTPVDITKLQEA